MAIVAQAPEDSLKEPVLYPLGILKDREHKDAAQKFYEFLQSDEAADVFKDYGFTPLN